MCPLGLVFPDNGAEVPKGMCNSVEVLERYVLMLRKDPQAHRYIVVEFHREVFQGITTYIYHRMAWCKGDLSYTHCK